MMAIDIFVYRTIALNRLTELLSIYFDSLIHHNYLKLIQIFAKVYQLINIDVMTETRM